MIERFHFVQWYRTMEGDKFKCLQYWPNDIDETRIYGNINQFAVTLEMQEENESFVERNLNVLHSVNLSWDNNDDDDCWSSRKQKKIGN